MDADALYIKLKYNLQKTQTLWFSVNGLLDSIQVTHAPEPPPPPSFTMPFPRSITTALHYENRQHNTKPLPFAGVSRDNM